MEWKEKLSNSGKPLLKTARQNLSIHCVSTRVGLYCVTLNPFICSSERAFFALNYGTHDLHYRLLLLTGGRCLLLLKVVAGLASCFSCTSVCQSNYHISSMLIHE